MKYTYTLLLLLLSPGLMLLVALPANAQTFGGYGYGHNLNGNTRGDVIKHASEHFDHMDANNDGKIEMSDLSGYGGRRGGSPAFGNMMLRQFDTNNDNVVSKEEFVARAVERFDLADTDKNGKINAAERKASYSVIHGYDMQQLFKAADTNGDGQLSPEEYSNLDAFDGNPQGGGYHRGYYRGYHHGGYRRGHHRE